MAALGADLGALFAHFGALGGLLGALGAHFGALGALLAALGRPCANSVARGGGGGGVSNLPAWVSPLTLPQGK